MNTHPITQPFDLGGIKLFNRMAVAPMTRVQATADGLATPVMGDYYQAYADGGFSLIITEGIYTDPFCSQGYANQPGLTTEQQAESWEKVVAQVKRGGVAIIAQLMHAGALSQFTQRTVAPSAIQPAGVQISSFGGEGSFKMPDALTPDELQLVKCEFVNAARFAWLAGFDGVELHAANGYLLDQFLTPHLNRRTDHYGGDIANRFRFIGELISDIRAITPAEFLLGLRLSEGKVNELEYRWPEQRIAAEALMTEVRKAKPDYVHIAVQTGEWERDSFFDDGSSLAEIARSLTGCPVIANGGLHNVDLSTIALDEGHADLIAIGKAALDNPDWPVHTFPNLIKPVSPRDN